MFQATFRPRNPLVRLLGWLLGILAVAAVLALGMFALAALVVGGALLWLYRALRHPRKLAEGSTSTAAPGIIDGEFTVIPTRPGQAPLR